MDGMVSRCAVAAVLALLFAQPLGAAGLQSLGFDTCRVQKDCRRLSPAELDRLRGGMSFMSAMGPIEITFGITQAVYINNKLVALTQFVAPGAGQTVSTPTPSPSQTEALNAALQGAPATSLSSSTARGASPATAAGPNTVQNPAPAATTAPVVSASQTPTPPTQTTGLNTTLNAAANNTASPAQTAAGSQSTASSSNAAPAGPVAPTVLVNGSTVTPGSPVINVPSAAGNLRVLIVQNGVGNFAVPSAADIRAGMGTVIQNTANDQAIRAVTQMNVSMRLSQAMSAASIRNSVRQGMVNSRP